MRRRAFLASLLAAPAGEDLLLFRGELDATRWRSDILKPVQPGSLWKPFLAASWQGPSPVYTCTGSCWLGRKHGKLEMAGAISASCNFWFDCLTAAMPSSQITAFLQRFGLTAGEGKWEVWPVSPRALLLGFRELMEREHDYPAVMAGLRGAATTGTARAMGSRFLAKTGTGPSIRHSGDGWVLAAWDGKAALYRCEGVTGAQAAGRLARRVKAELL